jgi:hypothetical protein
MNKHFVTHPDGTRSKRTSENRTYTHAVVETARFEDGTLTYGVRTWAGSEVLGQKALRSEQRIGVGFQLTRYRNGAWVPAVVAGLALVPVDTKGEGQ